MATAKKESKYIKPYYRRDPKSGKLVYVPGHRKELSKRERFEKRKQKDRKGPSLEEVKKKVKDDEKAEELYEKYKDRPTNLRVMLNTKWADHKITHHELGPDGKKHKVTHTEKRAVLSQQDWKNILKENRGVIGQVVQKYAFKESLRDDLQSEAFRGLYDAINSYHEKYDPDNPPDLLNHIYPYVRSYVQGELTRQMATRFKYPEHKRRIFNKFRQIYDKHNGDWDAIHKELDLKKKDVYPALKERNPKEAEKSLPKEGFTTVVKEGTLKKKTKEHEDRVNRLMDSKNDELAKLESRRKGSVSEDEQKRYEDAVKETNKQIEKLQEKAKNADSEERKKSFQAQAQDMKERLQKYQLTMSPLDEDEYERQKDAIEQVYQEKLRRSKEKLDKEIGRTTIPGSHELFKEFEDLMSFTDVNLNEGRDHGEGDKGTMEEIVPPDEYVNEDERISIRESYYQYMNEFESYLENLDDRTEQVLRMRLGLSDKNEMYAHGLWGKPMSQSEISQNIDRSLFPKYGEGPQDDEEARQKFQKEYENWKAAKPSRTMRVKKDEGTYKKERSRFDKNKKKAKNEISKELEEYRKKHRAGMPKKEKDKMKEKVLNKYKASDEHEPKKFTTKKLNDKEFQAAIRAWKAKEPEFNMTRDTIRKEVGRALDVGSIALRRMVPKEVVQNLLDSYRKMRKHGIQKGRVKEDLAKSLLFDAFFGVTYGGDERFFKGVNADVPRREKSVLAKAWLKAQELVGKA